MGRRRRIRPPKWTDQSEQTTFLIVGIQRINTVARHGKITHNLGKSRRPPYPHGQPQPRRQSAEKDRKHHPNPRQRQFQANAPDPPEPARNRERKYPAGRPPLPGARPAQPQKPQPRPPRPRGSGASQPRLCPGGHHRPAGAGPCEQQRNCDAQDQQHGDRCGTGSTARECWRGKPSRFRHPRLGSLATQAGCDPHRSSRQGLFLAPS